MTLETGEIKEGLPSLLKRKDHLNTNAHEKLNLLLDDIEELKERIWQLDDSTDNNLLFFGIKENGFLEDTEASIKEVYYNRSKIIM